MNAKTLLVAAMVTLTSAFLIRWFVVARARRADGGHGAHEPVAPTPLQLFIGAITNFFDTLGIGSYAPTTAMFRAWHQVPDEKIPGTLNVGHVLPTVVQAVIFTQLVEVEFVTLAMMLAAAAAGAWLGAGIVAGLPRRSVQVGMGTALVAAAGIMLLQLLGLVPGGGAALGLDGWKLAVGIGVNFILGALMTLGIGLYAPCMILISLLGMNPTAAFPIMMGSCAFLMPVGGIKFVQENAYHLRAAIGLTLGGPLAVLVAAFIVKSLPLLYMRWLVVVVVLYTATSMLAAAAKRR
ncbi:MAG: permease [Vicinamibacterales bacterium]